jgi:hypothetical protein
MNQSIEFKVQIPSIMQPTSHSDAVLPCKIGALLLVCLGL